LKKVTKKLYLKVIAKAILSLPYIKQKITHSSKVLCAAFLQESGKTKNKNAAVRLHLFIRLIILCGNADSKLFEGLFVNGGGAF